MTWPTRTELCLDCRSTITAGAPCHAGPSHRVRALTAPAGREQVLDTVWGPKPLRQRMRELAKAGATGGGTGGVLGGLADCGGCGADVGLDLLGTIIIAAAVVAMAFVAVAWVIGRIVEAVRRYHARLVPRGAHRPAAAVGARTGRTGEVVGAMVSSPLSGRWCVGFDARLVHGRRAVMLRDAMTIGFEVALDDGARVRIPPGPLIVDRGRAPEVALSEHHVEVYLRTVDPARIAADDLDPFPRDRIEEALICAGDRVEVLGPLRAIVEPTAAPTGYRAAAATILVPAGPTQLRLLDPEQR